MLDMANHRCVIRKPDDRFELDPATQSRVSRCVRAVQVTVKDGHVNGTEGGSATLLCTYKTVDGDSSDLNIQWTFMLNQLSSRKQIYYFGENLTFISPEFKGRLLAARNPRNASITIEKLRPSDTGTYICEVENPPDFQGNNIGSVILTVLVPPSEPKCGIAPHPVKARVAILTCHSDEGVPDPIYHWVKIVDHVHQNITGHLDIKTGTLIISNISDSEHGTYQCIASNKLGNKTCNVDLSQFNSDSDVVIGGIVGAVLIAAVIGIIIWVVTKKAKKKAKQNVQKGTELQVKEDATNSPTTYVAVPTDAAAKENPDDAQAQALDQNNVETPEVHDTPSESLLLNEDATASGSEEAVNKESGGNGPQAI
ncbi:V-set and immunoglobulin domain-containing protein 1-like [Mobula birostris]|uniref:V-set and immunoglobulin domain-containing protein 1-like n=1 Tax=Mobula birostris TaxID=1983395 RepID=UPI003B27BEA8